MRRDQIAKLEAAGITAVAQLADAPDERRRIGMSPETFAKLRRQASLQVRGRDEPGAASTSCSSRRRRSASRSFRSPRRATSSSIWRATRCTSRGAGSNIFSVAGCPTRNRRIARSGRYDRARGEAAPSRKSSISSRTAPPLSGDARLSLRRTTRSRRCGGSRSSTARAKTRSTTLLRGEVLVDLLPSCARRSSISEEGYGLKNLERFYRLRARDRRQEGRRVDRHVRALADGARSAHPRRHRSVQPRRLPFDAPAARVAARATRGGHRARSACEFALRPAQVAGRAVPRRIRADVREVREAPARTSAKTLAAAGSSASCSHGVLAAANGRRVPADARRAAQQYLLANLMAYHRREEKPAWWAYFDRCENVDQSLRVRQGSDCAARAARRHSAV